VSMLPDTGTWGVTGTPGGRLAFSVTINGVSLSATAPGGTTAGQLLDAICTAIVVMASRGALLRRLEIPGVSFDRLVAVDAGKAAVVTVCPFSAIQR
jgi:hypothetical protein